MKVKSMIRLVLEHPNILLGTFKETCLVLHLFLLLGLPNLSLFVFNVCLLGRCQIHVTTQQRSRELRPEFP